MSMRRLKSSRPWVACLVAVSLLHVAMPEEAIAVTQIVRQPIPVAAAQVGEGEHGERFLRRVDLVVIGEPATIEQHAQVKQCVDDAFRGSPSLAEIVIQGVDDAYAKWAGYRSIVAPDEVLNDNALAKTFAEVELKARASTFAQAINDTQTTLRVADETFRKRLVTKAACNPLAKSMYVALIQRICQNANCGLATPTSGNPFLNGQPYANRFEMLMAWSNTLRGNDDQAKSILALETPVMIGPLANTDAAKKALGELVIGNRIAESKQDDLEIAFERLVKHHMTSAQPGRTPIIASAILVAKIPKQVAVRVAHLGLLARPDYALTHAVDNPNATFLLMNDEVARRRLLECASLRGVSSKDFAKLQECTGYVFTDFTQVQACLAADADCRPKLAANITLAASEMRGFRKTLKQMTNENLLPRLRDATFKALADNVNEQCSSVARTSGEMNVALSRCVMQKALTDPRQRQFASCAMATPGADVRDVAKCMGNWAIQTPGGRVPSAKEVEAGLAQLKDRLDCADARSPSKMQECAIKLNVQADEGAAKLFECVAGNATASDRVECLIRSRGGDAAKLAKCSSGSENEQIACLRGLLPQQAMQAQQIMTKCGGASSGAAYIGCASALGVSLPPGVETVVECTSSSTTWTGSAACMARKNTTGPAAEVATCYAESSNGGTAAVGACIAGKALGFNQDLQMLAQCTAATSGEPLSTAGCTMGKLALREFTYCKGKRFGEGQCFGAGNTLVQVLHIGPNSTVAQVFNLQLDVVNGFVAFAENPGATTEATLRNAGHELTIVRDNVYKEADKLAENVRREVGQVIGPGVYVKVEGGNINVGGFHARLW